MATRVPHAAAAWALMLMLSGLAWGADIVVQWAPPAGRHLTGASALLVRRAADALGPVNTTTAGAIAAPGARFSDLAAGAYDLSLTVDDGTVLQGVNMNWYSPEPPDPTAGPVTADDQQQILAIIHQSAEAPAFFNHADLLAVRASSERAVALVQLVRDLPFHSDKGDEVIWRVELWYLKNENGGWAKLPDVSKMIHRERLASHSAYVAAVTHLRWVPALGDVEVGGTVAAMRIELPPNAGVEGSHTGATPATAPQSQ